MDRIAIIGLGLMGASLAKALKRREEPVEIHGYARRAATRERALETGVVDAVFETPSAAVAGADLVVVCVPIWSIAELAREIAGSLMPGAVVTDVGSTKSELVARMDEVFADLDADFVGSHPIAGSEKTGVDAGDSELYAGRMTVVCPSDKTCKVSLEKVTDLWSRVGAEVVMMSAPEHDRMLAATSHLPHMVAAALARSVAQGNPAKRAAFCGTGFKDTTRVASGSADMWVDIIDTNRVSLEAELDHFRGELEGLISILREGNQTDIRSWLEQGAADRDQILEQNRFLNS